MRALLSFDWPGDVRQLENALEYATAVCDGQTIHVEDLPAEIRSTVSRPILAGTGAADPDRPPTPSADRPAARSGPTEPSPSAEMVAAALNQTRHRRGEAAKLLDVSRTTLWRRMKQLGLG